jgi:hypothetical protein
MPPRIPRVTSLASLTFALLSSPACTEPKRDRTEPPAAEGDGSSRAAGSSDQCVTGGPSVAINIRGDADGNDMGTLLGWIGGFVEPCRKAPSQAPYFTLDLAVGPEGQPPTLALRERQALPGLAACLDERFAEAPAPPAGPMTIEIVIPWGCPTLPPGFQSAGTKAAAEPSAAAK